MSESTPPIGFLTVVQHEVHGHFGGYLVLNANGRPVEFHCTAPVKPNRAQEILYGPTLEPYLYGEQIGQTLINKSKTTPMAVCTDLVGVLAAREFVSLPVVFVAANGDGPSASTESARKVRIDPAHSSAELISFELGRNRVAVSARHPRDRAELDCLSSFAGSFDLAEPFERIRSAIEEAQRAGR
ncbi:MAG TPA: hypothetical protein VHC22_09985 [Pirellulales bacterium]|nr:hypothetical protein [Pirellulales bacterium]